MENAGEKMEQRGILELMKHAIMLSENKAGSAKLQSVEVRVERDRSGCRYLHSKRLQLAVHMQMVRRS